MSTTTQIHQKISMAASSDIGSVRKENEDSYYYSQSRKFFVVCDGMGGHQKGALASKFACETVRDLIFGNETIRSIVIENKFLDVDKVCDDIRQDLPNPALKLLAGVRLANRRILNYALHDKKMLGMGTTLVVAMFHDGHIIVAHVGDSRIYRLRNGELTCMTTDHSWLNELLEDQEISESEVKTFQKKNVLTRALGISPAVKIDLQIAPVEPDDLYLLCSDGLCNALQNELIHSILTAYHGSLQNKVSNLVSRAKMMDGSDNITAGLIHVNGQWNVTTRVEVEFTIGDEPSNVSEYIEQLVKTIYPVVEASRKFASNKVGVVSLCTALFLAFALVLFYASQPESSADVAPPSGPVSKRVNIPLQQAPSRSGPQHAYKSGGQLVLLQIDDGKYVQMLNDLTGVRVLDAVQKFSDDMPVHAGNFTWAVADAREKILYKRRNLYLQPVAEWHERSTSRDSLSAASQGLPSSRSSDQTDGGSALVYLLGDFYAAPYRNATIVINEQPFGALGRYKDSGFYLKSGSYDIRIVDKKNNVLKEKLNMEIKNGETIAIEF